MDDDAAQALAYALELEHEYCEHGLHPDRKPCLECLVNEGEEDAE
jgi:hypothetical protein